MAARGRRSSQLVVAFILSGKIQFILLFLHVGALGSFSELEPLASLTPVGEALCLSRIPRPVLSAQVSPGHTTSRLNTSHCTLEIMMGCVSSPWFPG